jgi:GTPase
MGGTSKDEKENPEASQLTGATQTAGKPPASVPEVHTKFIVDSRYFCKGVGLILGGTVLKGTLRIDQQMMFGPDRNGNFKPVVVKGIHENRVE